jgi:hyperosmotically inducible periplasmic protein
MSPSAPTPLRALASTHRHNSTLRPGISLLDTETPLFSASAAQGFVYGWINLALKVVPGESPHPANFHEVIQMSTMFTPSRTAAVACALFLLGATPVVIHAQDQSSAPSQTAPDNSARNKDHNNTPTADQQSANKSDTDITRDIRRSIVSDKSLSTYAHNVKIITQNGAVTLKGPVNSDEEKQTVASKAAEVVGGPDKVTNQLTVKQ